MIPEKIVLATGNAHKLREVREILTPLGIEVCAPADVGGLPEVIEDGDTFAANAIKKAVSGMKACGLPVLADDSGIEALALDGAPGIYSARYAGPACDDQANNEKLVRELANKDDKRVQYRCVIAYATPEGELLTWDGIFAGIHTAEPQGAGGFGYDPYVYLPEKQKTVAELNADEKHALSHRGQALRKFVKWIQGK